MTNHPKGILWMLIHCLAMVLLSTSVKYAAQELTITQIVFFNLLSGFLLLQPVIHFTRFKDKTLLHTSIHRLYILRAIIGLTAFVIFFYSLQFIPVADATAITFTGPLFTTILAVLFLKETIGLHRAIGLAIGFIGAWIVIQPSGGAAFNPIAALVFVVVLLWSINTIIIKQVTKTEKMLTQLYHNYFFQLVFAFPLIFFSWQPLEPHHFLWFLGMGFLNIINSHALFSSLRHSEVSMIMPFVFSQLIFASILGYMAFGEVVTVNTVMGATLIVGSIIYIARREKLRKQHIVEKNVP